MKRLINLIRFICLAAFVCHCESSIKWSVINKPIKIGDKATLSCDAYECAQNTRKTWYGGRSNDLLCYDDISTNPTKYEMQSSKSSFNSSLTIKEFNVSDVNCKYTCACGFEKFTKMLKLDDLDTVYGDVKDSSNRKDDRYIVNIEMKVYPIPICSIVYKAKESYASVKIVESVKSNKEVSELYTVKITAALDVDQSELDCSFNVKCQVKPSKDFLILDTKSCTDVKSVNRSTDNFMWLGLSLGIITIVLLITIVFLCLRKKLKMETRNVSKRQRPDQRAAENRPKAHYHILSSMLTFKS
ncbi:uncharacterized protein [Mytilus edulis]|uniref:uncharacterized protein n=1 Tax=Mytilus edulis TaxID=6550 RepID=UPI0039F05FC0